MIIAAKRGGGHFALCNVEAFSAVDNKRPLVSLGSMTPTKDVEEYPTDLSTELSQISLDVTFGICISQSFHFQTHLDWLMLPSGGVIKRSAYHSTI